MGIPFWRFVSSDSDGHATHQCLACKQQLYVPSCYGWKFCPFCGIAWQGELKWDEDKKARHKLWYYDNKNQSEKSDYEYVIQECTTWNSGEPGQWKDTYSRWNNKPSYWNGANNMCQYSLDRWKMAVAESKPNQDDDDWPSHYTVDFRLIARWPDGRIKVILSKDANTQVGNSTNRTKE